MARVGRRSCAGKSLFGELRELVDARIRFVLALAAIVIGYLGRNSREVSAEEGIGYFLGVLTILCMLLLLVYPLRKRIKRLKVLGSTKDWFSAHMTMGALATLTALYHCNFQLGSLNSRIALYSLLLVAASGVTGRFIYTKIHHGLNGRKRSLKGLLGRVRLTPPEGGSVVSFMPQLMERVRDFDQQVLVPPNSFIENFKLPLVLGARTRLARYRLRKFARRKLIAESAASTLVAQHFDRLDQSIDNYLRMHLRQVRKVAEFLAYERLFSLWHAIHLPFFLLLVISVVVHVIAVHWY